MSLANTSLTLWLDDVQKQSLNFIDNDTRTLTDVRLGAQGVETGTRGTIYFDDFESRRFSYIGTLTDPGVNDPTASNQAGWFARTYTYSASIPHAVTSVSPETGSPDTYTYDANGNMLCRIESGVVYTHTYNAENRAASIAKRNTNCTGTIIESWSFAYDGDGVRVLTAHFTGTQGTPDSTTAYYMGGAYEVKDSAVKKYYSIAGMMVVMKDASGLQYLLTDHLGSTVAVTNQSGTLTSQQRYLPFGAARTIPNSPILGTDFTYTGQRLLDSGMGGIMDYKARFYSPALGRFVQPDTIIPNPANPQSWNRYSYVTNRPVNFNDPTGHIKCEFDAQGNDYCYENDRKTKIIKSSSGGGNGGGGALVPVVPPGPASSSGGDEDVVVDTLELDAISDQSCTVSACSTEIPCPLGQTCISPWTKPAYWDLDPQSPDYTALNISYLKIFIFAPTFQFTVDRYGQVYFSGGLSLGTESITPYPNASLVQGTIGGSHDKFVPGPLGTESFLTGPAINLSGGALPGLGATFSPLTLEHRSDLTFIRKDSTVAPFSMEGGAYTPQFGVSATFGIKLPITCTWCTGENP